MSFERDLKLEWRPGSNGSVVMTTRLGAEVIHVDQLELCDAAARQRYAAAVCDGRKGIDQAAVSDELLRMAAERTSTSNRPSDGQRSRRAVTAARYAPFPVSVLPEPLRSLVIAAAQAMCCDLAYVALPALAVAAAAIGTSRRIRLKRGWTEPAAVWTVIVGESGAMKTPPYKLAVDPLRQLQGQLLREHEEKLELYERQKMLYEKELAEWKRDKKSHRDPPVRPEEPRAVRVVISDTTVEAIAPILLANPRGLLLARDELAGWIGSFDRYSGGRGSDAAQWLSMHNGESIIVDRKTGTPRTIYVPQALVSVTGSIQPEILRRALGSEHRESGLAARLLFAYPPRRPKQWSEAEIDPELQMHYASLLEQLHGLQPSIRADGSQEPVILDLTPEAKRLWIEFYNQHAAETAGRCGDLAAAWSKLEGYAARLALVVQMARQAAGDPTADPLLVDARSIEAGVALSRWFGGEAEHVYGAMVESDEDRDRRQLVEKIVALGGRVTAHELRHRGFGGDTGAAEAALCDLVQRGHGRWDDHPPGPNGGRPTRVFIVDGAENTKTETLLNPAKSDGFGFGAVGEVAKTESDEWGEI